VRILLDTHTIYWYTTGDPQLSATAQSLIQVASNEVLISPASYWEIAIKVSKGKWKMNQPFEDFLDACLDRYGFQVLPIEPKHAVEVSRLPFPTAHRDPFDRLLVSQALVEQIPIVSIDAAFDPYGITRLW
jgi:PIN domain nuclease of toxin-antitoxin system